MLRCSVTLLGKDWCCFRYLLYRHIDYEEPHIILSHLCLQEKSFNKHSVFFLNLVI